MRGTNLIYKRAKLFRHIHLLNVLLNGIQKGPPILVFVFAFTVAQALAFSSLVGNLNSDYKVLATLLLVTVQCFMGILIIMGQMGVVYQKSNTWIRIMQRKNNAIRDRKWEKRFYKSCSTLKIMISGRSFVDKLTPLNCLQYSMTSAASLLLLRGN